MLEEENLSDDTLLQAIDALYAQRENYIQAMEQTELNNAVETIVSLIDSCTGSSSDASA